MRKILTLAVLVLLIILASCDPYYSYTFKEDGRQVALVYGLDYVGDLGKDLNNTVKDAEEIGTTLHELGYEISSHTSTTGTPYWIEDASRSDILDNMPTGLGEKDTLLFYFSGHGALFKNDGVTYGPGDEQVVNSEFYGQSLIFPEDASDYYEDDVIFPSQLFSSLQATGAGQIIVILDICNSGGFVPDRSHEVDGLPENYTDDWPKAFSLGLERFFNRNGPDNPYPNIHVISAAGKDEESYESDSIQNGYFTYFMLQSLGYDHGNDVLTASTSADENKDGVVTLSELYGDTFARFEASYLKSYESETITTQDTRAYYPHITGGSGDPIVFYLD
jgi:hypothetical protein